MLEFYMACTLFLLQVERFDREHLSRKTNLLDNMTDVFTHKWAESDPVVRSFDRKVNL